MDQPDATNQPDGTGPPDGIAPFDNIEAHKDRLGAFELFGSLSREQRAMIDRAMTSRDLVRGEVLVREGEASDSFFTVLHGALAVRHAADLDPFAEVRAGDLVGEVGFFARIPRTADVIAIRDSRVLVLTRAAYTALAARAPGIIEALLAAVARRLAMRTAQMPPPITSPCARTVTVVDGGIEPVPPLFYQRLRRALTAANAAVVDHDRVAAFFPGYALDSSEVTGWLNALEHTAPVVVYFSSAAAMDWTQKATRQSDSVVVVCRGEAPAAPLTAIETAATAIHGRANRRLVRVHDQRCGETRGTAAWLARMPAFMHHHVALSDDFDIQSLVRFLTGNAVGFVAAGGGGLGPNHIGIYRAFRERGVMFDIFVGTSAGAAMVAGFAKNHEAEQLERGTHDVFVTSRSLKRPTWPRYALLDHKMLDRALQAQYGADCAIEDCWRPFAAVATNLSTHTLELMRSGPVWEAVRASSAIPGLLPPFYTRDGMMLVDGCLIDNVPLAPMHHLKTGPNLVVHFGDPVEHRFAVDYGALPGRLELLAALLLPLGKRHLPAAPSAINVLWRSLVAHQRYDRLPLQALDHVMCPPLAPGAGVMEFDHHRAVSEAAYHWAQRWIDARKDAGDPAMLALLKNNGPPLA